MTYGLIALCCLIFILGPASGIVPGYGTGYVLQDAQRVYFRTWGWSRPSCSPHPWRMR